MMVWRRLGVCLMLVALVAVGGAALAQDGQTAEQDALIGRVLAARAIRDRYTSYVISSHQTENRSITITLGGVSQTISEVQNLAQTATVVKGETDSVSATLNASVEKNAVQASGREVVTTYAVSGEARLVGDVLYLNAALDSGEGPEVPTLPEGWFEVENTGDYPFLNLADLRHAPSVLDDEQQARAAADVALEQVTLEDGTTADQITMTFDKNGLSAIMGSLSQEADPVTQTLLDAVSDDFEARIVVTVDAGDHPLRIEILLTMDAFGVDAHALAPDQFPEGVTMDFHYERSETEDYSAINAPVEPVVAPVIGKGGE
jgi:hypothetical protein